MKRAYSVSAIALFISLFIYLIYRTEKTVVNEIMMLFLSPDTYVDLRRSISKSLPLNEQIIFSLPGGLWVFCTTLLAKDLSVKIRDYRLGMAVMPVLFAIGLEFCQLIHLTNGTFDPWDIGFSLLFCFVALHGFQSTHAHHNYPFPLPLNSIIWLACFLSVYLAHVSS